MSTHCNIAIILNEEDSKKFRQCLSDERFNNCRPIILNGDGVPLDYASIYNIYNDVKIAASAPYNVLSVYCHFDGYPTGVGADLLKYHNSYEKALALILCGDLSFVEGNTCEPYAATEGIINNKPHIESRPTKHVQYLYTFKDGRWQVPTSDSETGWMPIEEWAELNFPESWHNETGL